MNWLHIVAALALGLVLSSTPAAARETGLPDFSATAAELRALTESVDRLTRVLEAQAPSEAQDLLFRKLDLAIAYLNFRSRRIEMLEQDMQAARNARDQIASTLNVWLQKQEEIAAADSVLPNQESRQQNEEIELRIKLVRERVEHLDSEIVILENKIYELQEQIDSVEAFVRANLVL